MSFKTLSLRFGVAAAVAGIAACSSMGNVGDILGSVLGQGGGGQEVAGTVQGVNTQSSYISLQQSNGQSVALQFDDQTRVVYQNHVYAVTALDPGDQVQARVQQTQGGGYYTDSVDVLQPASSARTSSGNLQSLQGTVTQLDRTNGTFTLDAGNAVTIIVQMPYNASSTLISQFNALRNGQYVSFSGVYIAERRVELRQFN
jgi:hypothetical protein